MWKQIQDSILDLIFSSEPGMINYVEMRQLFGYGHEFYSDHRIITCDIVVKVLMHIDNSRVYDLKNANIEGAISLFNKINWSQTSSHIVDSSQLR